jgi:hypothetical protein
MPELIDLKFFQELATQDPLDVCRRAVCTFNDTEMFYTVPLWDQHYKVYPRQCRVEATGGNPEKLHPYFELFLVHYLLRAKEIEPTRQWISEKDIPGGSTFFRGPHAIPTDLIANRFENDLAGFSARCEQLGGTLLDMADIAFIMLITPRIPVAVLYWQGDEEFPPESKILYDATIAGHLAADIIFALACGVCDRLGRSIDGLILR